MNQTASSSVSSIAAGSVVFPLGARHEAGGYRLHQIGVDQGLITLHIDNNFVLIQSENFARFGQAISARRVVVAGENGLYAVFVAGPDDGKVVTGDDNPYRR